MTTYYYNEDATGTIDGLTEATGYDGSTTATLPDSSSGASRLSSVVGALQSGDILYVKKASGDITWHASIVTTTQSTDGPTRATGVGPVDVIGYGTTPGDGIRPNINMGSTTWRFNRAAGMIKSLNFKGSYANAGVLTVQDGALITECRIESSAGPCIAMGDEGKVDRCELINTESVANPAGVYQEYAVSMYCTDNGHITNCYIESQNGSGGIYVRRRAGTASIINCIINVNLDVDSAGNSNGHGIEFEGASYGRGSFTKNIIHNASTGILLNRSGTDDRGPIILSDTIFSSCSKAIDGDSFYNQPLTTLDTRNQNPLRSYNNIFYANTTNSFINNETDPTYLTTDPFVDVASKDFTIKNPNDIDFLKEFQQAGASGDTITKNTLIGIRAPGEIARSF
jgi:hypothetical protein